jgi:hypothetical protein
LRLHSPFSILHPVCSALRFVEAGIVRSANAQQLGAAILRLRGLGDLRSSCLLITKHTSSGKPASISAILRLRRQLLAELAPRGWTSYSLAPAKTGQEDEGAPAAFQASQGTSLSQPRFIFSASTRPCARIAAP